MDEKNLIKKLSNRFETIFNTIATLNGVSSLLNMTLNIAIQITLRENTESEI